MNAKIRFNTIVNFCFRNPKDSTATRPFSLMSPQCCKSPVNHYGFIHPAINLSPREAAALSMNLNVCRTAGASLQFPALVVVWRAAIREGCLYSAFEHIFCFLVFSAGLSCCLPVLMITLEWSSDLLHHRCPGFGLTYPLQSVLCMQSQASGLNWLCNSSFDLISHLVGGYHGHCGVTLCGP